jgi:hypothetical protein
MTLQLLHSEFPEEVASMKKSISFVTQQLICILLQPTPPSPPNLHLITTHPFYNKGMQMLVVSETYQNYKNDAVSNQLTVARREAVCVGNGMGANR